VSRFDAICKPQVPADRKQLGQEDYEHIAGQLFPGDAEHILKPKHFEIFVTELGLEGTIILSRAKNTSNLQPAVEEYHACARWTGKQGKRQHGHDPSTLTIIDAPKEVRRSAATYSAHPLSSKETDLYH
jgi:hypothetical protein